MPIPPYIDPTTTDDPRAVRDFNFSKIGQSKLPPSLRKNRRSEEEVSMVFLHLQDGAGVHVYMLKLYS